MVSQTKRNRPRARDHTQERKERNTLRFPPPTLQRAAADAAPAADQRQDDDDINDEWFTTGIAGEGSTQNELPVPDSGDRSVTQPRLLTLENEPERTPSSTRRRRLLAIVSLIVLSSVVLIAVALVTREQRDSMGSRSGNPSTPMGRRVESASESRNSGRQVTPPPIRTAAEVTAASKPIPMVLPVMQPSAEATVAPLPAPVTQRSAEDQRLSPGAPQPQSAREVTSPRQIPHAAARAKPRSSNAPSDARFDPGIPLSQIFVNRDGDLVDVRGKPLDWKSSHAKSPDAVNTSQGQTAITQDADQ